MNDQMNSEKSQTKIDTILLDDAILQHQTKEPKEPVNPLTLKETWGFYGYAIAYLPYTLASSNLITAMITVLASMEAYTKDGLPCYSVKQPAKCFLPLGGSNLPVESFALYVNSAAVIVQAIFLLLLSALADREHWRTRFIIFFTMLGGIPASLCFIPKLNYVWVSIISILANVGSNMGSGFCFSMLPLLAWRHQSVISAAGSNSDLVKIKDQVVNNLSAWSLALGMLAGSIILFAAVGVSKILPPGVYSLQVGVGIAGAWFLIIGTVSWLFLSKPKGPPLPAGHGVMTHSLRMIWKSILQVPQAGDLWLGLLSWFFISDGLASLVLNGVLVGQAELQVKPTDILLLSAFAPISEAVGILVINYLKVLLAKSFPKHPIISSSKTITIVLCLAGVGLSLWGLFGIRTKVLYSVFFFLSVTLYACSQSIHRALFAQLVPEGQESEFFGLYLLSARTTSWIGFMLSGYVRYVSGSLAYGFIVCLSLFVGGILALIPLRVGRTIRQPNPVIESVSGSSSD